jgi:hypothetical protein
MIECENTPEFENDSDFGGIITHKEFESIEGGYIKGQ